MSSEDSDAPDTHLSELLIIRHRSDHDGEGHHGGVWKIAYADFMTAMMAFFLVMWLINAANEETKAQVASYFNPIKLIDSRTSTKGLQDLESGSDGKPKEGDKKAAADHDKEAKPAEEESEAAKAEHEAAAAAAEEESKEPGKAAKGEVGPVEQTILEQQAALEQQSGEGYGQTEGDAYLDPFDPQSWQQIARETSTPGQSEEEQQVAQAAQSAAAEQAGIAQQGNDKPGTQAAGNVGIGGAAPPEHKSAAANPDQPVTPAEKEMAGAPGEAAKEGENQEAVKATETKVGKTEAEKKAEAKAKEQAERDNPEARSLEQALQAAAGTIGPGATPSIEVRKTGEGVLISLTDTADFGMFEISSAKPRKELVQFMQRVAKVLNERKGNIVISGHTDARPFKSAVYDNWKLSSARAQMAYDMLVKAGVVEQRVERIEGHADRALRLPEDPHAAQNRRIEILLREVQS